MRIYRLANIIAIPPALILLLLGYLSFLYPHSNYLLYLLFPALSLVLLYLFAPQINYWWLSRHPVELDKKIIEMLNITNPIYKSLSAEEKREFDKRLVLYIESQEFFAKGMEEDNKDVPYDIKNLICQVPVTMTFYKEKFSFRNFERVVLYKHPFPSPRYKFLHTAETEAEDGVVILSLEHVERALFQKGHHYDIAWHAYAEAYISAYPAAAYPEVGADIWDTIERISPQTKDQIYATLGYKSLDPMPTLINLYFNYPVVFREELPKMAESFDLIFQTR